MSLFGKGEPAKVAIESVIAQGMKRLEQAKREAELAVEDSRGLLDALREVDGAGLADRAVTLLVGCVDFYDGKPVAGDYSLSLHGSGLLTLRVVFSSPLKGRYRALLVLLPEKGGAA